MMLAVSAYPDKKSMSVILVLGMGRKMETDRYTQNWTSQSVRSKFSKIYGGEQKRKTRDVDL